MKMLEVDSIQKWNENTFEGQAKVIKGEHLQGMEGVLPSKSRCIMNLISVDHGCSYFYCISIWLSLNLYRI